MSVKAVIQIIGSPVVCSEGYKDTWRDVAEVASAQMKNLYGDTVEVTYFDLFDPACPTLSPGSQLPLVLINNQILSSGGKISIPRIRKRLQELGFNCGKELFLT